MQLFNHIFLYNFHRIYKAPEYKVSVGMTTRRDAGSDGSAVEKINTLSMRCGTEWSNMSSMICGPGTGPQMHHAKS